MPYGYHSARCIMCGGEFTAHRRDAKTCSDVCRKRLSRHPMKRGEVVEKILTDIKWLMRDDITDDETKNADLKRIIDLAHKFANL